MPDKISNFIGSKVAISDIRFGLKYYSLAQPLQLTESI